MSALQFRPASVFFSAVHLKVEKSLPLSKKQALISR